MTTAPTTLLAALLGLTLAAAATPASPAQTRPRVTAAWAFDADAVHPGSTIRAAVRVNVPEPFHVNSSKPLDEFLIPTLLTVTPPPGFTVREIAYPKPVMLGVSFQDEPLAVFESEFVIGVALEASADVAAGVHPIGASLQYQACDDRVCLAPTELETQGAVRVVDASTPTTSANAELFTRIAFTGAAAGPDGVPPETQPAPAGDGRPAPRVDGCDVVAELDRFTVLATAGGYLDRDEFLEFVDEAETGAASQSLFEGKGPLAIVLLVILGGLALNLTPCVLPLVPINLAIIGAGAQAGSRARGFALGGTYGLAMAAVYGILGLVVILTTATFGAINSTIWFNVSIAVLFVLLALAMFDVIHIDFSKYQTKLDVAGKAKRGTFALAFGMGAVSALLAGACVAPVVIQVVVYAGDQYARGTSIALALPFCLGLGMALPWPFAGAGLSFLPKPGKWMVRVKQAMGVFILLFAAWYGYLAWEIHQATRKDRDLTASAHLEPGWTASICEGFAQARDEDKPLFIDMWATWCKNCFAMDKTTFKDEDVVARLDGYVKVKLQSEELDESPIREVLARFDGIGLPTYAILEATERRSDEGQ